MGTSELAYRGWQEAAKSLDRLAAAANLNTPRAHQVFDEIRLRDGALIPGAKDRAGEFHRTAHYLLEHFHDRHRQRFFRGAENRPARYFPATGMPEACSLLLDRADAICGLHFKLLGFDGLFFGNPVDWHLDPVSGRRAPRVHWSQINPLDVSLVGDSKVTWELNRHQWLVPLGQAYCLTGDERYACTFVTLIREWMQANPPGIGINWSSSLEVSLRLISWCWASFLFRGAKAVTPGFFVELVSWIRAHAAHVERYLSYYYSPNTHLTGEALGLFYAGVVFPEMRRAGHWRDLGRNILLEQCERQVFPDGVYFEQSACYQRYSAEIFLHFLILSQRNGVMVPADFSERLQRLLDCMLAWQQPDGALPQIGDTDGGCLLPLSTRGVMDCGAVFSTAAVVFRRPDYAWAARGLAPDTLWLLGSGAAAVFNRLAPAPPGGPPSRTFPHGGYVVMRSGWDREAHQLIFDVGPLGCPVSGGHGHADLLGLQCSVFGEPFLVDPGTHNYTAEPEWRNYFRSSAAHSTVLVDGLGQSLPSGPFAWKNRPRATLLRQATQPGLELADAVHDGYHVLQDPVTHRRRVCFVRGEYWLVVDDLDGRAEHHVEVRFQFSPVDVAVDNENWVRAIGNSGRGLLLKTFADVNLEADVLRGVFEPMQGWVSVNYGQRHSAPVAKFSTVARLPLRLITLLIPARDPAAALLAAIPVVADGRLAGLTLESIGDTVRIDGKDISIESGKPSRAETGPCVE